LINPKQCRAARAWLEWSQYDLAARAEVSNSTIRDFETGRRIPIANNLKAIQQALESAGLRFIDTPPGITELPPRAR
jgi:transcriptional regulator with XRE-family HTH domain